MSRSSCNAGQKPGGRLESLTLLSLSQAGGLALQITQVVKLRAADTASTDDVDMVDYRSLHRENALDALAKADLAHRNGLPHSFVMPRDDGAFESLQPLFVAFFDLDVHADRVAGTKLGVGALVLLENLRQKCMVHCYASFTNKSGRRRTVFSSAASRRHLRISS